MDSENDGPSTSYNTSRNMGVSKNSVGKLQNGWFIMENLIKMDRSIRNMDLGNL